MNEKILSLLGISRRAGCLCIGHNAVISSVVKNKAGVCVLAKNASDRLRAEIRHACSYKGKSICCIELDCTSLEIGSAVGVAAAVLSVTNAELSGRIVQLYNKTPQGN